MQTRRIQIIAGSTYSISLPKDWIKRNNLKEKEELNILQNDDGSLIVSPKKINLKRSNEISINIKEYPNSVDQILYEPYYLGFEKINFYSKEEFPKDARAKIRKAVNTMIGTEIIYEDKNTITIGVLLDKSKVDMVQLLYRIFLLIDSSITNVTGKLDRIEIKINEGEIDKIYHLITKIISLSLLDSVLLESSKIKHIFLIPSYLLISKRLENIGDVVNRLSAYLAKNKIQLTHNELFEFVQERLNICMNYILRERSSFFEKTDPKVLEEFENKALKCKDVIIGNYKRELVRYMDDIEFEILNISLFYDLKNKGII